MTYHQECFNQFLLFLRDPQAYPHPRFNLDTHVFLDLPDKPLMYDMGTVKDVCQTATEIAESGIFRDGRLKGNQRTPDQSINNIEEMILELAGVVDLAKKDISFWETLPLQYKIEQEWEKVIDSFDRAAEKTQDEGLIGLVKMEIAREGLINLKEKAEAKAKKIKIAKLDKDKATNNLTSYFVRLFLIHVPNAPGNLITSHIYDLLERVRTTSGLDNVYPSEKDAIRKRVNIFKKNINTPKI